MYKTHRLLAAALLQTLSPLAADKPSENFRVFDETSPRHVKDFYLANHTYQTLDFVIEKKGEYLPLRRTQMGIWEAMDIFDTLVDESDPDISLPQRYHCFQTAEAMRKDHQPRWMILTGLIHDLGKILYFFGEPQWAVVGDTFPVGCAYSPKIVFPDYFANNPDTKIPLYQTPHGVYSAHCGLDNIHMSWGHDEYLYHVVKDYLPKEAGYIIRYHSFYPMHHDGEYAHLMSAEDNEMLPWVQRFQKYDLYSKDDTPLDIDALMPYYRELVAEFFPKKIDW
jgi:inositol oxygenase